MGSIKACRRIESAAILGSSGFLGSWICNRFRAEGIYTVGIGRTPAARLELSSQFPGPDEYIERDLNELVDANSVRNVDAIVFAAGSASVPLSVSNPTADLAANVTSLIRLLELVAKLPRPPLVVHLSSAAVYGKLVNGVPDEGFPGYPVSPYGVSKMAAEAAISLYARNQVVPGLSLRPFSVYGPGQRKQVVFDLTRRLLQGESPLRIDGSPNVERDFLHAADFAEATLVACRRALGRGEAYNVGSGTPTSLRQLARTLVEIAADESVKIEFSGAIRAGDPVRLCSDAGRLGELGWAPSVGLRSGLEDTVEWIRSEGLTRA